ncbi:L domain-like protein [Venturia nashicola]|uniref:U2 small nuclear ribonucleoprotein A' n=1 Tax=Venturia nashicola TaxID=86259 RepID=A0A4Z1PS34_9PEZI|nr:L domain-like protein [Venturia nashicola]TLD37996.1 L domain-like protein [Venturia nashicola]
MRLTADLIQGSLSYINPLKERELDLRGHKIPHIENLGAARDNDCIDFTDNDIAQLANFPLSPRIRTLLLARNRVASIQPTLHKSIPGLTTLVLTSNRFAELADLDPLKNFASLTHLTLVENPVTRKENYRLWLLWRCRALRFLDFQKVKVAEREKADELFGTYDEPTPLAQKILNTKSRTTFDLPSTNGDASSATTTTEKSQRFKFTEKEMKKIAKLSRQAKSIQEINALEKALAEGRIPGGADSDDEMEG